MSDRWIKPKATVFTTTDGGDCGWLVAETPSEVLSLIEEVKEAKKDGFVKLTLANDDGWNSKPLHLKPDCIVAISPPRSWQSDLENADAD